MEHVLVEAIEKALSWDGPGPMGDGFARGSLPDPALCERLLTPTRLLDVIMRRTLSSPQLRCFQGGSELHPDAFLANIVTRRGQSLSMARMNRLGSLMRDGCTLVVDALDSFDPTMEVVCRALQWWSREIVQVNTYLTTNESRGFDLHWDDHDVVIVQVAGEKSWEVRGASRAVPMFRDAEPNRAPSEEIVWAGTMRQGDVMHIPRGYWHQATRADHGDGYSLHLTFGFVQRTGVDWLTWLADRSREHEAFRHDLDRCGSRSEQLSQEQSLRDLATDLVGLYSPGKFLEARELERATGRHVSTLGVFGPPTDVVCVTAFPPMIERRQDTVEVIAAGKVIAFAGKAENAVRQLVSGSPVNVETLSGESGIDATVLAETLIAEGMCAEMTEALTAGYAGVAVQPSV